MTARPQTTEPGYHLAGRLRWLRRARPADYLLALSVASASLPVVGKSLEPLGGVTAMGVWGARHMPRILSSTAKSWFTPGIGGIRKREREQTNAVSDAALRGVVSAADLDIDWPEPEQTPPVWKALQHRRHIYRSGVRYGSDPAQVLDVWRPRELPDGPAPVLIFVPGGAWVHGSRHAAGLRAAVPPGRAGLGVPVDRLSGGAAQPLAAPHHRRQDRDRLGARQRRQVRRRPQFRRGGGGSAGGHLAALAGLTGSPVGDREYADQLPAGADTSVDAVVGHLRSL